MDIGKEAEEPVEFPIPTRAPVRREAVPDPEPATAPVEEPAYARVFVGANSPLCGYCGNNDHTEVNCPFKPRTK
jgi:hypothetical protein